MKITSKTKYLSLVLLLLFIIDRTTKYLTFHKLPQQGVYLFKQFQLQLQINTGIAFGFNLPPVIIFILTTIIVIFLFYYLLRTMEKKKYLISFFLGLIIIGALSNLIDRIVYQGVIDFIQISIWPNFNLADAYISLGAIILLIISIKKDSKENL